jgi:hypothetical protein
MEAFDEDHLYAALDWFAARQDTIEQKLYRDYIKRVGKPEAVVLYDVSTTAPRPPLPARPYLLHPWSRALSYLRPSLGSTSSYFEGECNELAALGYNRDKKHGKKQGVIGLLTADDGEPLAVRVFAGNTADPSTVYEQINRIKRSFVWSQFGIDEVVLIGDRGMIKAKAKAKDDCTDAGRVQGCTR